MTAKSAGWAILAVCLTLLVGCRTSQPVLKPDNAEETLVAPPDGHYDTPKFPREAFDNRDDRPMADAPRSFVPTSGIGSQSNGRTGPYKF
jgi:hypothetical protein